MKRLLLVPVFVVGLVCCLPLGEAQAHHTTVTCVAPPGTWKVVNSEGDKAMTFTSPQGPSGSIAAGGSTTVQYVGTSLTIVGTWSNGVTNTSTGSGSCNQTTTTTQQPATTTPSSTSNPTTSTAVPTTSTSVATTLPTSTTSASTAPSSAAPPESTLSPSTTGSTTAPSSSSTVALADPPVPCTEPTPAEDGSRVPCGYWADPPPSLNGTLPATGYVERGTLILGFLFVWSGLMVVLAARRGRAS